MRPGYCALLLALAASLAIAASAKADDAGRYALGPSRDGFVRLDTATGAVSHCTQSKAVWRCQPLPADTDRVRALATEVAALAAKVAALKARFDSGNPPAAPAVQIPAPAAEAEMPAPVADRSLFAVAMDRFINLVRALKHGRES